VGGGVFPDPGGLRHFYQNPGGIRKFWEIKSLAPPGENFEHFRVKFQWKSSENRICGAKKSPPAVHRIIFHLWFLEIEKFGALRTRIRNLGVLVNSGILRIRIRIIGTRILEPSSWNCRSSGISKLENQPIVLARIFGTRLRRFGLRCRADILWRLKFGALRAPRKFWHFEIDNNRFPVGNLSFCDFYSRRRWAKFVRHSDEFLASSKIKIVSTEDLKVDLWLSSFFRDDYRRRRAISWFSKFTDLGLLRQNQRSWDEYWHTPGIKTHPEIE